MWGVFRASASNRTLSALIPAVDGGRVAVFGSHDFLAVKSSRFKLAEREGFNYLRFSASHDVACG